MKTLTKISATAILMIVFASSVFAQSAASANASATIITPIAIAQVTDMAFGNIAVQTGTGGTVILAPAGTRTTGGGGGVTLPTVTGTVTAASFNVTGSGVSTYSIAFTGFPLTITSGLNTMLVSAPVSAPSGTGTLTAGAQTVTVGATLTVAAAQPAGSYTSATPFTVTVNYN